MQIMKPLFNYLRNFFAILGILTVCIVTYVFLSPKINIEQQSHGVSLSKSDLGRFHSYIDSLRSSGQYMPDTAQSRIRIIQDSTRAQEIRDYFQLDTLYSKDADTWTKSLQIGKFVASNIPHDNQVEWPKNVNAIGLWEYTKEVAPAFNCRLHSILTFELLLAAGIDAKYVTCMPMDKNDNDCHVVNEVWLPELNKWAMLDTDMGGYFVTDLSGTPLSLSEMREHYISGEKMQMYPGFKKGKKRVDWYYAYMAKNTYWFSCWGELSYYQEDYNHENVVRDHYYHLVPSGFEPFRIGGGTTVTSNATAFWADPHKK